MALPERKTDAAPDAVNYELLLAALPTPAYACNPDGRLIGFNEHAASLWGRRPALDHPAERFCGSHALFSVDGAPLAPVPHTGHFAVLESLGLVAGPERRAQLRDRAAAVIAADAVGLDGALLPGLGEADVTRLSLGGGEAPSVKVFLDGRPDSRPSEVAAAARLLCATRSSAASASP